MKVRIRAARVYANMIERCYSVKHKQYKDYGGRGITIDDKWLLDQTSFTNWYLSNHFDDCQVDRIDNDGPYSEYNCKMSTRTENVRNRRSTVRLVVFGENKTLVEWLEDPRSAEGLNYNTLQKRINSGWNPEECILGKVDFQESIKRSKTDRNGNYRGQMPNVEKLTAFGESKTLHEWSIDPRCKVDKNTLWYRKSKGWDMEKAITTPPAKNAGQLYEGKSVLQWSKDPQCQVSYKVLNSRLKKGIPLDTALKACYNQ